MDRARSRGGEADADLVRELGMRAGHEGGEFLVARLDDLHLLVAPEGAHDAVHAIARVTVDALHAPLGKPLQQEITYGLRHGGLRRIKGAGASLVPEPRVLRRSRTCMGAADIALLSTIASDGVSHADESAE